MNMIQIDSNKGLYDYGFIGLGTPTIANNNFVQGLYSQGKIPENMITLLYSSNNATNGTAMLGGLIGTGPYTWIPNVQIYCALYISG